MSRKWGKSSREDGNSSKIILRVNLNIGRIVQKIMSELKIKEKVNYLMFFCLIGELGFAFVAIPLLSPGVVAHGKFEGWQSIMDV